MLRQLRSSAASIIAKLLVVLLIFSFAAWGVTDYIFQAQRGEAIATVGDKEISPTELGIAFQNDVKRYQQQGLDITVDQAKNLGLLDQTLQRLISARVYEAAGDLLGMGVSDNTVRSVIQQERSFFDETGRFSRNRYERILASNDLSEGQFVRDVRRDIVRRQIINSLDYSGEAPDILVKALHRYRGEKRIAVLMPVPVDKELDVGEPDADTLQALYEEDAAAYTAPERRRISFIHLTMDSAMRDVVVTEERLHQRYEENIAAYTEPETRTVQQMLLTDEESAKKAAAIMGEGRTFQAVAKEVAGQEAAALELGSFSAATFPEPALWDTVATLELGGISEPVESGFGWHIFRVTDITPEKVQSFEEARDRIDKEIRNEEVAEVIYRMSADLDDELAGGATLEEAAKSIAIETKATGLLDIEGIGIDGKAVEKLPGGDFLETAFLTEAGETSPVIQLPGGEYYVLRVDEVVPSALRPFDEVRTDIVASWKADRRFEAARERALGFVARIEAGESLADIAAAEGLSVTESQPFDRRGTGAQSDLLTPVLVGDMFKNKPGQAAMDESPDAFTVAQLKSIQPVTSTDTGDLGQTLGNQMIGDILAQFNNGLREEFRVQVNQTALNRF